MSVPALSAGPARRTSTVFVATAFVAAAAASLMGGMLALWLDFRAKAPTRIASDGVSVIKDWLKKDIAIPEVAATTMMFTFVIVCVMAQWAVYAGRRGDKSHTTLALAVTMFTGLALLNVQVALWMQMDIVLRDDAYQTMFYTVTGMMFAIIASAVVYSLVAMFRVLAGRTGDHDVLAAHALYWYATFGIFTAVWLVVYVQK
ncbi:MAG: cytochrome c oxidase subunit 3 [Actinomycetota bacterium]